jgi:hypothetical protein
LVQSEISSVLLLRRGKFFPLLIKKKSGERKKIFLSKKLYQVDELAMEKVRFSCMSNEVIVTCERSRTSAWSGTVAGREEVVVGADTLCWGA